MSREGIEADAERRRRRAIKAAARRAAEQAALRASDEPLARLSDLLAAEAERDELRRAIARHRYAIEAAGRVLVVVGRDRARRKHVADRALWARVEGAERGA